jgi:ElaB/YqjD/DUF883 family membrane-anchored ribosome-binding protein
MLTHTRRRLADDFKAVLTHTQELLDALASESKDEIADLRPRLESTLKRAKGQLSEIEETLERRARHTARDVDAYAHENPWRTAGMAAGLGAVIGSVIGALLVRR